MTKNQIVFRRSPMERRRCLLDPDERPSCGGQRIAEVAGGTTAECAAVICCFPCAVVNILVLAVFKVPAGLCRKVLKRNRRRRLLKKTGGVSDGDKTGRRFSMDGMEYSIRPVERLVVKSMDVDEEFVELENEMWETFCGTGFWRSLSQRVE